MAVLLVFLVLLIEFRSLLVPLAIVWGSLLSLFGVELALLFTSTSLNIISFLGAIIGIDIVAKNGILMLDRVEYLRAEGMPLKKHWFRRAGATAARADGFASRSIGNASFGLWRRLGCSDAQATGGCSNAGTGH